MILSVSLFAGLSDVGRRIGFHGGMSGCFMGCLLGGLGWLSKVRDGWLGL